MHWIIFEKPFEVKKFSWILFYCVKIFNEMNFPNSFDWILKWWYGMLLNVAKQSYNLQVMQQPMLLTVIKFTVRALGCILFPNLYGPSELREWDRKNLSFWNRSTGTVPLGVWNFALQSYSIYFLQILFSVILFSAYFLQIIYISKIRNEIPW